MALPAQAIEKLTHSTEKTQGAFSQLVMLSFSVFALALFFFLGLNFGYKPYLENKIDKLQNDIDSFAKAIPEDKQAEAAIFYSQLVNLKNVLGNHVLVSPYWDWLEAKTLPAVYYTKVTVNTSQKQMVLNGMGKTLEDVTSQISLFEKSPEVKQVVFSNSVSSPQGSQFLVTLTFKEASFKSPADNPTP